MQMSPAVSEAVAALVNRLPETAIHFKSLHSQLG